MTSSWMPSFTMQDEIERAIGIVQSFSGMKEGEESEADVIPLALIESAVGVAFLTVIKVGFIQSVKAGSGIVIARLPDGSWSAPSAIGTGGLGWGPQFGAQKTEFMFLLNSAEAVRAFSGKGNVSFGAEMGIAAGPLGGRSAGAEIRTADGAEFAPVYSYSHNKGIFAGMSMEGSVVSSREDCNAEFYNTEEGAGHHPEQLLTGEQPAAKPAEAQPLYDALNPGEWPARTHAPHIRSTQARAVQTTSRTSF